MSQDNTVKIGINMDHQMPGAQLSKANLDIEYPSMDRDVANVLQFEIALITLLRITRMAVAQCAQQSSEMMPAYVALLDDISEEIDGIRKLTEASPPETEAAQPRGVIR
jgi:hypothetical protein